MYSCHLYLISSASVRFLLSFLFFIMPFFVCNVPFLSPIFLKRSSAVSFQLPCCVWVFVTPWTPWCNTPGLSVSHHLPKFAQVHVHCISDAIQLSHPLIPSSPSAFSLSQSGNFPVNPLFTSDGPKYWSFNFSISPFNEYSGLISLMIDRFDRIQQYI